MKKILLLLTKAAIKIIILLLSILVIFGLTISIRSLHNGVKVQRATQLLKENFKIPPETSFAGCVYPKIGMTIISLNGDSFFSIKDKEIFIPKINNYYENNAKKITPNLPVKEVSLDIYYLMEYCR